MIDSLPLLQIDAGWFDPGVFASLALRFAINLAVAVFLIGYVYFPRAKDKDYVFTFITVNTLVFFVTHLLMGVDMQVGLAFGLFALFSILRFRTLPLATKEMTYLFAVVATGLANSVGALSLSVAEVVFMNASIIVVIYILDAVFFKRTEMISTITYEKIENIKPQNRQALLADLSERTGLVIDRVSVGRINFLNDTARVKIYYSLDRNPLLEQPDDYFEAVDEDATNNNDDELTGGNSKPRR